MSDCDVDRTWYHGSPLCLETLAAGSTITPLRHLAEVFSHKPRLVVVEDDGSIHHDGTLPGYLYTICEPVGPDDVYRHPRTTMEAGWEWLTKRELKLMLIDTVEPLPGELLSADQIALYQAFAVGAL